MSKTQIGRSCFKFLKRKGRVSTNRSFYDLYVKETCDQTEYTTIEHYFCGNSSKYRTPSRTFIDWCTEKLNSDDTDLAQHFTVGDDWLTEPVKEFIQQHSQNGVVDPYAGNWSLKAPLEKIGITDFMGYDIDPKMCSDTVRSNDSLISIPEDERLLVTNPPYMSKCTATRYGSRFYKYFETTTEPDIYLIALDKCLKSHKNAVAIIPETFLLNRFYKDKLALIVIIESSMFTNTNCPVLVACFTADPPSEVKIYKNNQYLLTLKELYQIKLTPTKNYEITFNDQKGNIGLRGIDGTQTDKIAFCTPAALDYDRQMKVSSRLISIISIPSVVGKEAKFIEACNEELKEYRLGTYDLLMAPFKGNNKNGERRRRIDYTAARALMEKALIRLGIKPPLRKKALRRPSPHGKKP